VQIDITQKNAATIIVKESINKSNNVDHTFRIETKDGGVSLGAKKLLDILNWVQGLRTAVVSNYRYPIPIFRWHVDIFSCVI
jgi:hypothetical protein